jgi:hypothetical protein
VPALNSSSPKYTSSVKNTAEIIAQQDGHRVYPRYPDGRSDGQGSAFLEPDDDGCAAVWRHARCIGDYWDYRDGGCE